MSSFRAKKQRLPCGAEMAEPEKCIHPALLNGGTGKVYAPSPTRKGISNYCNKDQENSRRKKGREERRADL